MPMMTIRSHIRDYDVHFVETPDLIRNFESLPQRCYVVDANVWRLHSDGCLRGIASQDVLVMPISEERKCLETVQELYDRLMGLSAKRNMTMISIGGGILQDISGFAASTFYRGINWMFVPTTFLAQADSCIGAKTSLNYRGFKNLLGTFYPPGQVFVYPSFLQTQADADFFSGLGEAVKLHLLGGADTTQEMVELLPHIVRRQPAPLLAAVQRSLSIKQTYIADDEFDRGRRNLLNFGHCFGHALESTSDFQIPHGQAVALGMLLANGVARRRGILSEGLEAFVAERLLLPSLVIKPQQKHLDPGPVVEAMKRDKKRTGDLLALVMMADSYEMRKVDDLTAVEVADALADVGRTVGAT